MNSIFSILVHLSLDPWLFVPFSYYEKYCHEHGCINICKSLFSILLRRSGIAGSFSNSIFNFLRNLHALFHSGCVILHSQKQWMYKGSEFSTFLPTLPILYIFLLVAIPLGVKEYLTVVLICVSLMISDIGSLFMCLLAIWWWFSCSVVNDSLRPRGL